MAIDVKKYTEGKLYCYKYVSDKPAAAGLPIDSSQKRLHQYLNWADKLLSGLDVYCLIRYTPALADKPLAADGANIKWKYNLIANDFTGLGVDLGFVGALDGESKNSQSYLFQLHSVQQLKDLPEDMFGDFTSHVSLFGLQSGRGQELQQFTSADVSPELCGWLQTSEIFVHITVGKEEGYYDAFLVKAGADIQDKVAQLEQQV